MDNLLYYYLDVFNSSKLVAGLSMIILNIAGRYIDLDLSTKHKNWLASSTFIKRVFIFVIFFIATRDILVSVIFTCIFVIVILHLFNNESNYCILKNNIEERFNGVSEQEVKNAYDILRRAGQIQS